MILIWSLVYMAMALLPVDAEEVFVLLIGAMAPRCSGVPCLEWLRGRRVEARTAPSLGGAILCAQ